MEHLQLQQSAKKGKRKKWYLQNKTPLFCSRPPAGGCGLRAPTGVVCADSTGADVDVYVN